MPQAHRLDRRVHYAVAGTGSTVVLVPGIGTGMHLFGTLPRRFARAGYRCIAFDPVGVPPSSPLPGDDYDFAAAADDLLAVLDAADAADAHLVGTSLGGKVALTAAARAPTRTRTLSLLASAAVVPPRARAVYRFFATVAAKLEGGDIGTVLAPFLFGSSLHANRPQLVEDIVRAVRPGPDARKLMLAQARALLAFDGAGLTRTWTGPTLCVAGGEDTLTLPTEVRATAALWPHARYVEIPDAGHSLLLESPRVFEVLVEFFDQAKGP